VGPAYQAAIPSLESSCSGTERARTGNVRPLEVRGATRCEVAMADEVCKGCSGAKYGAKVIELPPGVCITPGTVGHLPAFARKAIPCPECRGKIAGYCRRTTTIWAETPGATTNLHGRMTTPLSYSYAWLRSVATLRQRILSRAFATTHPARRSCTRGA
jgi:hypothetical protein